MGRVLRVLPCRQSLLSCIPGLQISPLCRALTGCGCSVFQAGALPFCVHRPVLLPWIQSIPSAWPWQQSAHTCHPCPGLTVGCSPQGCLTAIRPVGVGDKRPQIPHLPVIKPHVPAAPAAPKPASGTR